MISEFPLLVFTVLTGLAAGGYVMSVVYSLLTKTKDRTWVFSAICLVLFAVGMLASLLHLGHPERFLNALSNPSSMITLEAYCAVPFGVVILIDTALLFFKKKSNMGVAVLGAVLGCALMAVTSNLYFSAHAYVVWTQVPTWFVFLVGNLAMGAFGVVAFNAKQRNEMFERIALVFAAVMVVALLVETYLFGTAGYNVILWILSVVFMAAASILLLLESKGKFTHKNLLIYVFACTVVAIVLARYAFYAIA